MGNYHNLPTAIALSCVCACSKKVDRTGQITPEYNQKTGSLQTLRYDSNGDGRVDIVSTMDGGRVVRIEIDKDFDGKPDRWEYYDAAQKIEKVGFSRLSDGTEDAWSYSDGSGGITRIEVSTKRDGKAERIEHYANGKLTSAEEDTDGNGKPDKWERYDGDRLAIVAFDTEQRGVPDRRLVYGKDGTARMEVDPKGTGNWTPR